MNCLSEEEIVDYLFAGPSAARAAAEAHLAACPACSGRVEVLRLVKSAAAALAPAPVSAGFTARLMRELEGREPAAAPARARPFFGLVPAWGLAFAVVACALYAGAFFFAAPKPAGPAALNFSDGPATMHGNSLGARVPAPAGTAYEDTCGTARCGLL
jgi:anti-sigma factor RsiW